MKPRTETTIARARCARCRRVHAVAAPIYCRYGCGRLPGARLPDLCDEFEVASSFKIKPALARRLIGQKKIPALVSLGFIDVHPTYRLVVHGWAEHCNRYVHRKLIRENLLFATGEAPKLSYAKDLENREPWKGGVLPNSGRPGGNPRGYPGGTTGALRHADATPSLRRGGTRGRLCRVGLLRLPLRLTAQPPPTTAPALRSAKMKTRRQRTLSVANGDGDRDGLDGGPQDRRDPDSGGDGDVDLDADFGADPGDGVRIAAKRVPSAGSRKRRKKASSPSPLRCWFDETFVAAYPNPVQLVTAWRLVEEVNPDENQRAQIMARLERWKTSAAWTRDGGKYIPGVKNFFADRYYARDPIPPRHENAGANRKRAANRIPPITGWQTNGRST